MSDKMTDTKMLEGFAKEFKPFVSGMIYFDDHASRFRACEPYTIGADSAAATINYKWIGWKAAWQAARTVPEGWIAVSDRLPAPYQHVFGLWSYANGVTEMEVTMYECDGVWFDSKEPEYWFPFPAAPEGKK